MNFYINFILLFIIIDIYTGIHLICFVVIKPKELLRFKKDINLYKSQQILTQQHALQSTPKSLFYKIKY